MDHFGRCNWNGSATPKQQGSQNQVELSSRMFINLLFCCRNGFGNWWPRILWFTLQICRRHYCQDRRDGSSNSDRLTFISSAIKYVWRHQWQDRGDGLSNSDQNRLTFISSAIKYVWRHQWQDRRDVSSKYLTFISSVFKVWRHTTQRETFLTPLCPSCTHSELWNRYSLFVYN